MNKCRNTGIKYLLMSLKLGMARFRGKKTISNNLYKKLLREYDHIPLSCRKAVARELKIHSAYHKADGLKEFRTWSERHLEDAYDKTFDTSKDTLKLFSLKDDNLSDAFYKTFQEALRHQQQDILIPSLNNAAWEMKDRNLKKATEMAKELGYYIGYYVEDSQHMLSSLDTQLNTSKLNEDYELFYEYATLYNVCYEQYAEPYKYLREMYQYGIRQARKYALIHKKETLKSDEIANGKGIRNFLNEWIRRPNAFATQHRISHASLYRILNGERKIIKIHTLKKIVKALDLDYSFDHHRDINYVLWVMEQEKQFETHREKFDRMADDSLRQLMFKGIFISQTEQKPNYHKLFSLIPNRKDFLHYLDKDFSSKVFINRCFNNTFSFYRGRGDLLRQFFELIGMTTVNEKLIPLYTALKTNEEMKLLNKYFRAYTWGITIKVYFSLEAILEERVSDPAYEKIIRFCQSINLSELDGYLCTWFFDGDERERLIKLFQFIYLQKISFKKIV